MRKRKGIVLAGGSGTRLHPATLGVSKQLLPVYDKPMVYYPLSVLLMAGIEQIAIITTPLEQSAFRRLLGDGSHLGIEFEYIPQPSPDGLAQAFILAEAFLDGAPSAMVLGDNIFHGPDLERLLSRADRQIPGARVFGHPVPDPTRYGIIEADAEGRVLSLEEKPALPKSNLAATGLYFVDHEAPARARMLRPSPRGELEITALLDTYLAEGALEVNWLGRGHAWFDTGTLDSLLEATAFVFAVERAQGLKLGCLEEIALRRGLIDADQLLRLARPLAHTGYGRHLLALAETVHPAASAAELRMTA